MNLALVFSRKYNGPEYHFSIMYSRISLEILNNKLKLHSIIFFTNTDISFMDLFSHRFSIIANPLKVNQISNNVISVVTRYVFIFCCALTTVLCTHYNVFQHIFKNQRKLDFHGPNFQTVFLVTISRSMLINMMQIRFI